MRSKVEPNYANLDPEERNNKFMAFVSVALGVLSLCAGLIPIAGIVVSLLGLLSGFFGARSANRKVALVGIAVCSLGLLLSLVYAMLLLFKRIQTLPT
jgi:hypothetical protein